MNVDRSVCFRGEPKHIDDLTVRCGFRVVDPHSYGQRTASQSFSDLPLDLRKLFRRSRAMSGVPSRQECTGIVHHSHSNGNVPDADAEVNECLPLSLRVPPVDGIRSNLQLKRCRYSIARFELIISGLLPVLM